MVAYNPEYAAILPHLEHTSVNPTTRKGRVIFGQLSEPIETVSIAGFLEAHCRQKRSIQTTRLQRPAIGIPGTFVFP